MVFLITYDLKSPGRDYNSLYDKIKSLGSYFHPLESVWFVESNKSADDLYRTLKLDIDDNDYLFIVNITKQDRQGWMSKSAWEWLSSRN